jgi:cyclopropane fatty-acyl-phospholipid synthase-like methyltransferase
MNDYSEYLVGYKDAQAYDLEEGDSNPDFPLTAQVAQATGGPLLDLACGTGTMAIRMAEQGYEVTGVDIIAEMIAWAQQKALKEGVSIDWKVADARTFHLQKRFSFIYMLGNAFQHFLTREDHEALLARVREHLHPQGRFLFGTRNPSPRNLFETRFPEPQKYTMPDGRQYTVTEQQEYDLITQIQHYTFYEHWLTPEGPQEKQTLRTALRYVFPQEMEALLFYNGLKIVSCYGDWQQEPLTAPSRYMIYVCQKRVESLFINPMSNELSRGQNDEA